jgi:hypothetical protein
MFGLFKTQCWVSRLVKKELIAINNVKENESPYVPNHL